MKMILDAPSGVSLYVWSLPMRCTILLDERDEHAVERLLKAEPLANRHLIARAAVRAGLERLAHNTELLVRYGRRSGTAGADAATDEVQSVEELLAMGIRATGAASNPFADGDGEV